MFAGPDNVGGNVLVGVLGLGEGKREDVRGPR